jgi:hypothetical protein
VPATAVGPRAVPPRKRHLALFSDAALAGLGRPRDAANPVRACAAHRGGRRRCTGAVYVNAAAEPPSPGRGLLQPRTHRGERQADKSGSGRTSWPAITSPSYRGTWRAGDRRRAMTPTPASGPRLKPTVPAPAMRQWVSGCIRGRPPPPHLPWRWLCAGVQFADVFAPVCRLRRAAWRHRRFCSH